MRHARPGRIGTALIPLLARGLLACPITGMAPALRRNAQVTQGANG
jgi:hypothetical protein